MPSRENSGQAPSHRVAAFPGPKLDKIGCHGSQAAPVDEAPRHVTLVEDYILKNAEKPISMKDLEGIAEVSARTIHHAFRRFRGYPPKAWLQAVRLERAHRRLLAADPGERVTAIARSCGFAHLGRFSGAYKKRFGELPSQTLGRIQDPPTT